MPTHPRLFSKMVAWSSARKKNGSDGLSIGRVPSEAVMVCLKEVGITLKEVRSENIMFCPIDFLKAQRHGHARPGLSNGRKRGHDLRICNYE